jgi:hypothetical protein
LFNLLKIKEKIFFDENEMFLETKLLKIEKFIINIKEKI